MWRKRLAIKQHKREAKRRCKRDRVAAIAPFQYTDDTGKKTIEGRSMAKKGPEGEANCWSITLEKHLDGK